MLSKISELQSQFEAEIKNVSTSKEVEQLKVQYLGKKRADSGPYAILTRVFFRREASSWQSD